MRRSIAGLLIACLGFSPVFFSTALAHLEAVRVEAIFPTAGRSGIQLQLFGTDSGLKVTGAKIEIRIEGPGVSETFPVVENPPGIYRVDRGFQEGNYKFTVIDKTFDYEALERVIEASLPRPNGQDAQIWLWPATPPPQKPQPNQGLLIALLGIPALLIVAGGLILVLARRKPQEPSLVGPPAHFAQQRFPLVPRQPVAIPIRPRMLAPVIEEADVVVLVLERLDLAFDESVQLGEQLFDLRRNAKVHGSGSLNVAMIEL